MGKGRRGIAILVLALAAFFVALSLLQTFADGRWERIVYNFCGQVNVTIMTNGCEADPDAGPLSFFMVSDIFALLHTTTAFLFGMLFTVVDGHTVRYWNTVERIIAWASLWELVEGLLALLASSYFREVSGDSVIGDMTAAWYAGLFACLTLRYVLKRTPAMLWPHRSWGNRAQTVALFALYFVVQALATFEVVRGGLRVTLGYFVTLPLLLCILVALAAGDHAVRKGSGVKARDIDAFYLVLATYLVCIWGVKMALPWAPTYLTVAGSHVVWFGIVMTLRKMF